MGTINIQDEMQKIHHIYGVTEMANYKIQLFIDDLIIKDRAEQLVINKKRERSTSIAFAKYLESLTSVNKISVHPHLRALSIDEIFDKYTKTI